MKDYDMKEYIPWDFATYYKQFYKINYFNTVYFLIVKSAYKSMMFEMHDFH